MMSKIVQFGSRKVYFENVLPAKHFGDCLIALIYIGLQPTSTKTRAELDSSTVL